MKSATTLVIKCQPGTVMRSQSDKKAPVF